MTEDFFKARVGERENALKKSRRNPLWRGQEKQTDVVLKKAYEEMLEGCLSRPDMWEWYDIWIIELKDGTF